MTDELELDESPNHEDLSPEELLEQSQINAQALFMATATALAGDAGAASRWRQTLHDAYIRGWDADQDWEAGDILFALSTNYLSFGGRLVEWDYESARPSVVLENLPNTELGGHPWRGPGEHGPALRAWHGSGADARRRALLVAGQ